MKYEKADNVEDYKKVWDQCSYTYLSNGLDRCKHGDIEFLYEINHEGAIYVNSKKLTSDELENWSKTDLYS
jgi:hypothetical protein